MVLFQRVLKLPVLSRSTVVGLRVVLFQRVLKRLLMGLSLTPGLRVVLFQRVLKQSNDYKQVGKQFESGVIPEGTQTRALIPRPSRAFESGVIPEGTQTLTICYNAL